MNIVIQFLACSLVLLFVIFLSVAIFDNLKNAFFFYKEEKNSLSFFCLSFIALASIFAFMGIYYFVSNMIPLI